MMFAPSSGRSGFRMHSAHPPGANDDVTSPAEATVTPAATTTGAAADKTTSNDQPVPPAREEGATSNEAPAKQE